MSVLGKRLKEAREGKGLTQIEASKKLGISNGTLSGYERNYRDPDTSILEKMAGLYEVQIDWLLGRTNNPQKQKSTEEIYDDPEFQHAMRSAQGFSEENKQRVLEYIEMIEELEKGRKPGDKQPRPGRK